MELLSVTSNILSKKRSLVCVFFALFWNFIVPVFAETASDTLQKTDILKVGMDMYTLARIWETKTASWYTKEAFVDFDKKVNALISSDTELNKAFSKLCPDCDPIVQDTINTDKNLIENLTGEPKSGAPDLGLIIAAHFHPTIREKTGWDVSLASLLGKKAKEKIVDSIRAQVQEQTSSFRDVSGMGLYYDGDTDNSPYDLLDDIRRIDEIFFREAPEFGEYKNTSADDAAALITGKVWTGTWWGGKNYNIDLASEVEDAIRGGDSSDSDSWSENGEIAGDCDSGYCMKVDFIHNTHYFLGSGSGGSGGTNKGKNSFQGIFEEWLDWLIKKGDNRNFACQTSPGINTWESVFDNNAKLPKLFSSGIHTYFKTPPFMRWFFDRNKSKTSSNSNGSTENSWSTGTKNKEEQQVLDSLKRSFRRYDLDFDKPTNIKASQWQLMYAAAVNRANKDVRVTDTVNSIKLARDNNETVRMAAGSVQKERPYTHEKSVESIKHMEKAFDEIWSRNRMLYALVKSFKVIIDYLEQEKDKCQSA
jgi:hypothetical protein